MKKRKILIIGFIVTLIVAIPVAIIALRQQQITETKAVPATTLSFSTVTKQVNVGDSFDVDVTMNPGTNQVSFITLVINYDSTKVKKGTGIKVNTSAFPTTLEGPVYDQCTGTTCSMSITVSVGADPTKVVTSPATVATVNFTAVGPTTGIPTQIAFGNNTKVLSIGPSDQPSENVLSSTTPTTLQIGGTAASPSVTQTPTPTQATGTPTPTGTSSATNTNTNTNTTTTTTTNNNSTSVAQATNEPPACNNLVLSVDAGNAPLDVTLTTNGIDPDSLIQKATFNFGDGETQEVTTGGGLGTGSITLEATHTYTTPGSYTATVLLTDDHGAISDVSTCSQILTVNNSDGSAATTDTTTTSTTSALPETGPEDTMLMIGALGLFLVLAGGLFVAFAL